MATDLQVIALAPNRTIDVGPVVTSASWTTNALGGFGSASLTILGSPSRWVIDLPKLSLIRITQDETILFEGQIEDHDYAISQGEMSTTVQCFGLARLLSEQSVRRIWSTRDLNLAERKQLEGPSDPALTLEIGNFDATDLTRTYP